MTEQETKDNINKDNYAGNPIRKCRRFPRSQWLPALMLIYLIAMTLYYGGDLIAQGEIARLVIVFIIELAIIIALRIFLKKREERQ